MLYPSWLLAMATTRWRRLKLVGVAAGVALLRAGEESVFLNTPCGVFPNTPCRVITAAPAPRMSPNRRSDWRDRTALALRISELKAGSATKDLLHRRRHPPRRATRTTARSRP